MPVRGGVADGEDFRRRGAHLRVDTDAVGDLDACGFRQFDIRTTPMPMMTICAGSRSPLEVTAAETWPLWLSSRAIVVPVRIRTPVASSRAAHGWR